MRTFVSALGIELQAAMTFDPRQDWHCVIRTARYAMIAEWTLARSGVMLQ